MTDRLAKAAKIINDGAAIKSKIKEALDDLNRAYEGQRRVVMNACLDIFREERDAGRAVIVDGREVYEQGGLFDRATTLYYGMPDLHNFKAKHAAAIRAIFGNTLDEVIGQIEALAELRAAVKSVEVITRDPKEPGLESVIKARVMKSFQEMLAERKAVFDWATEIVRELNKELPEVKRMPVSINHVYCRNEHGTQWLRIDWYFDGRKVPFNAIAAAAQTVQAEKEGR